MKHLRKLLQGISLTAAMFVFQACYFHVVSAEDGSPLANVKIRSQLHVGDTAYDWHLLGYTNDEGIASVWASNDYDVNHQTLFRFIADDPAYAVKDTMINYYHNAIEIALSKADNAQ